MRPIYAVATRNVAGALAALVVGGPIAHRAPGDPVVVSARLWEWKVELSASTVPAGTVTFTVTNAGTIPHAFETAEKGQSIRVTSGGPVIQILPGPTALSPPSRATHSSQSRRTRGRPSSVSRTRRRRKG